MRSALDLDLNVVGGVTTSISGVTVANGRDGTFDEASLIAGSGNETELDTLTVSNSATTSPPPATGPLSSIRRPAPRQDRR